MYKKEQIPWGKNGNDILASKVVELFHISTVVIVI